MMKRFIYTAIFFFISLVASAQLVTENPTYQRKEARYITLRKVVITDRHTIVYMTYTEPTLNAKIRTFFKENPAKKRHFDSLNEWEQERYLADLTDYLQQKYNIISFQSTAQLRGKDGSRYRFIRVDGIPQTPQRLTPVSGETYAFKVYYEKLNPGLELIDIIEGRNPDREVHYWNYFGVRVNNPAMKKRTPPKDDDPVYQQPEPPVTTKEPTPVVAALPVQITLSGKVYDAETKQPVAAKISCRKTNSNKVIDSLTTSRSGSYEFLLSPENYTYQLEAVGYEPQEETLDLRSLKKSATFQQDFYLKPIKIISEPAITVTDRIDSTEFKPEVVKASENTFRLDKVYFKVSEASLLPESYPQLDGLARQMQKNPKMRIRIEGHTDNRGHSQMNRRLSMERAYAVRNYLTSKGIAGARILFIGHGDTQPIAPNDTEENRQLNRRVEFVILEE